MKDDEREKYYKFFKDKFNIDFNNMSESEIDRVLDSINKELDALINVQLIKRQNMIDEYRFERSKLLNLYDQVLDEYRE
jgi:hypothetical protein